jgi:hypothetical protein
MLLTLTIGAALLVSAPAVTSDSHSTKDANVIRWSGGSPGSESLNEMGVDSKILSNGKLAVRAAVQRGGARYIAVIIKVANGTGHEIQLDPKSLKLQVLAPEKQELSIIDPDTLASRLKADTIADYKATHDERPVDVRKEIARSSPRKGPNTEAQVESVNRTKRRSLTSDPDSAERARMDDTLQQVNLIHANALRRATIANGANLGGAVFFPIKNMQQLLLRVPLGDVVFEIPFDYPPAQPTTIQH